MDVVPIAANLSAPQQRLSTGQTSQLNLLAVSADGSQRDVTLRSTGTVYSLSNALMATVTENGLVTIFPQFASGSSARVVASATTEGSVSSTFMYILGPRGKLTGTVYRADSTTPVPAAQVSVLRLQPMEQAGTAVTNSAGSFALDDVNAGSFLISAIDPATGDRALSSARIENENDIGNVALILNGQGSVNVTVVDASGLVVDHTAVTFTALGAYRDIRTLNTDAQGLARFTGVSAGDFTVSARDPATRLVGTAVATLAVAGVVPITLKLQPVGVIDGVVYDVDGQTLKEGVQVRILSRERGILTQSVTAADGAFHFDTLPISDGPFTLDAFVDGRLRARVPGVVISQPNQTVPRNIVLGAVGVVTGLVKDPGGKVFPKARVTLQSLEGLRLSFDATTDVAGRFVLPAVPLGEFDLIAITVAGRTGHAHGRISADAETVNVDLPIPNNTLVGQVFERDGLTPVGAGTTVYLAPRSLGVRYSYTGVGSAQVMVTSTDEQGRFGFSVTRADAYYVQAEVDSERGRSFVVIVNLDPAQPLETKVVFLAKGVVSGLVKDASGIVQADVAVTVHSEGAFSSDRLVRTNAQGTYTISGVFAGDLTAVARNELTKLSGFSAARLDSEGQQVVLNITLAASGSVKGQVLKRDGSIVPGAVHLTVRSNNEIFASIDLPNGSAYDVDLMPTGDVAISAEEIASGDMGIATTHLASVNEVKTLDVRLLGQGTLRVKLVDADGLPVSAATVSAATQTPFSSNQLLISDGDGIALFARVFAGDFSVTASRQAQVGTLSGSASGTLLPYEEKVVTLTMRARAVGRIHGTVFKSDDVTPADAGMVVRMLPEPFVDAYVARTDAAGRYVFEMVEAATYNIDALNFYSPAACPPRDRIRGRATGVVLARQGEDIERNIQLIGQGKVSGNVTTAQGEPAQGIEVRVTNPDPVYGLNVSCNGRSTYDRITDASGNYVMEDVPPGDFTITAQNTSRTLRAEGSGRVRFDGNHSIVDLMLVDSAVSMPSNFYDANGFRFDINGNGSIGNGTNNVFAGAIPDNGGMRLEIVSNGIPIPFTNGDGSIGHLSQNGQRVDVDEINASGLTVTRRIYTPRGGYFTRYLELLENKTPNPITVHVRIKSHHRGSNGNPRVVDSSDGDQILSVSDAALRDRWVVVDDQQDADPFASASIPATGHLFDGVGGSVEVSSADYSLIGQTGRLIYQWNDITVAPGQSAALLHFSFQQLNRFAAREAAMRLALLPPEAIDDLTTDERQAIRNFVVPDRSSMVPLPNLDAGVLSGTVFSGDGVSVVPGAGVKFKSKHVLFSRERFVTTNAQGAFEYRSTLDGSVNNYVIPVFGYDLIATYPKSIVSSANTPGEFPTDQTSTRQDLIFISTGNVRGVVNRPNGALVSGAHVTLCDLNNRVACNDEPPIPANGADSAEDGRYRMLASKPRDYYLFAIKAHPQADGAPYRRDIEGHGTVTVTAGDTAVADVTLEPTGSVSGIVRAADGTPVVNADVQLQFGDHGELGTGRMTRSDTAGQYRFFDVPAVPQRVFASDAISHAAGFADVVIHIDEDTLQDIHLAGFGAITVNVRYARGVAADHSWVQADTGQGAYTDSNGVAHLDLPEGAYVIRAYHPDNASSTLAGSEVAVIPRNGTPVEITIALQPAGLVRGAIVRPDGTTLANGFPYTISQIRGAGAGPRQGLTSATGTYREVGLPLGAYLITAYDSQQDRFVDAEFAVNSDGEEVELNLSLLDNRIALPATMYDANRFTYDVQPSGTLAHGDGTFAAAGGVLEINGQTYRGDSSAHLEAGRRQFSITQPTMIDGLKITRKVFVPRGAYFARYIEVLENPGNSAISADLALTYPFAAGQVVATSSAGLAVDDSDRWVMVDDDIDEDIKLAGGIPATVHIFGALAGAGGPDIVTRGSVAGSPVLNERWNSIIVPAGGHVSLMHFIVQQINRRGAQAAAERLVQLPPEVLVDLTDTDVASIRNFAIPQDRASTLTSLPTLTASIGGITYEGDKRTPVRNARITVQSSHPLFNRVWGKQPNPDFCPPGTPVGGLLSLGALSTTISNPPVLGSYLLQGQLTAADSIPLPEGVEVKVTAQQAAPCFGYFAGHPFTRFPSRITTANASGIQDVIYDTGILTGSVVGAPDFSITSGRLYRSSDDPDPPFPVFVGIQSDATYVHPGLPPGSYDLLFDTHHPEASSGDGGLRGQRTQVQVTLGQITVTDVSMQPTGGIQGTVISANGEASVNAQVILAGAAEAQNYDQCASGCVAEALSRHKGKRAVAREVQTDSLGRYDFAAVPSGAYTLTVVDPISAGRTSLALVVADNRVTVKNVILLALGSAELVVHTAAGNLVADAYVYLRAQATEGAEQIAGRTDGLGHLTVPNIPLGNYQLRVRDPRHPGNASMDRTVTGAITANGQRDSYDIALLIAANLLVSVIDGDNVGAAVANAAISISDAGGDRSVGRTDASGHIRIDTVPIGAYTVRAQVRVSGVDKDASFTDAVVAADDLQSKPVLIDVRSASIPLPVNLWDANNRLYSITSVGAQDSLPQLALSGSAFAGATTATQQLDRRQYTIVQETPIAGLNVTRKVFVPRNGYFARYLEILENRTTSPVTVDVKVQAQINGSWQVMDTSSGDALVDTSGLNPDHWFSIGFNDQSDSAAFVASGPEAALPGATMAFASAVDGNGSMLASLIWPSVTVAPGQRAVLMHFAVRQLNRAGARASAERLLQLPPEATVGLVSEDIAAIRNFVMPADGQSLLSPLPALDGTISGRVLEGDGINLVPYANMTLRSQNPLFSQTYTLNSATTATYLLTGVLLDNAQSIAIPLDTPVTISAQHPVSGMAVTLSASFAADTHALVQDIHFASGEIAGSVIGAYPPHTAGYGSVTAYRGIAYGGSGEIQANGSYRIAGLVPGTYRLVANFQGHSRGALTSEVSGVVVALQQITTQDIALPPNGAVSGRLLSVAGAGVPRQMITLRDANNAFVGTEITDDQGSYVFNAVPADRYSLETTNLRNGAFVKASVLVSPNQTSTQDLLLSGQGMVTITARYARGETASDTQIYVAAPSIAGDRYLGQTTADGTLLAAIPIGTYIIKARHPLTNTVSQAAGAVSADGEISSITVNLEASATLRLHVLDGDADGAPAVNAAVQYRASNASAWNQAGFTDADGWVTVVGLTRASYEFAAYGHGGQQARMTFVVEANMDGQTFQRTLSLSALQDNTGALTFLNERQLFGINANAGDHIAVSIVGALSAAILGDCAIRAQVYSPSNATLAAGYGYGASGNFAQYNELGDLRDVAAVAAGFYSIVVSSQYPSCVTSAYRLSVMVNTVPVAVLPYQHSATVAGHIYRPDGATAVAGAVIRLSTPVPPLYVQAISDSEGAFVFEHVPLGVFSLSSQPLAGASVNAEATDFSNTLGATFVKDLVLPASTLLNIQILGVDGNPFPRQVQLSYRYLGRPGQDSQSTDGQGHANYRYVGNTPLLLTAYDSLDSSIQSEVVVNPADGETVPVLLTLASAVLHGRVLDADGAAVAGVSIVVLRSQSQEYFTNVTSDALGAYDINTLPGGAALELIVRDPYTDVQTSTHVDLIPGQTIQRDLQLLGRGTVTGTVRYASGGAIQGAQVEASYVFDDASGYTTSHYATTDANGRYSIEALPVGRPITIRADINAGPGEGLEYSATAAATLTSHGEHGHADIVINIPGGVVVARIRAADGLAVAGYCSLRLESASQNSESRSAPCADALVFNAVPAGVARLYATISESGLSLEPIDLTVVEGQSVDALFNVTVVKGVVRFADGNIVPSPSVALIDASGETIYAVTSAQGDYRIQAAFAGNFEIQAQDSVSGLYVGATGTVADPAVPVVINLELQASGSIAGFVYDAVNQTVANAHVYARSSGLDFDRQTQTDAQGSYRFDGIALGSVALSAIHPDTQNVAVATVQLSSNGENAGADLHFPITGTLVGIARMIDGGVAPEACVSMWSTGEGLNYAQLSTNADEQGHYVFASVVPGPLIVEADSCDQSVAPGLASGQVASNLETTLDVQMGNGLWMPQELSDSVASFTYRIAGDGGLFPFSAGYYGNQPFWDVGLRLSVTGVAFPHQAASWQSLGGRELTLGPVSMSGLRVSRRVYLPLAGGYSRVLETLSNSTPANITVSIRIAGMYAEARPILAVAPTSNGGHYAVHAPANPGNPASAGVAGYVFAGANANSPTRLGFVEGQSQFDWGWTVTVPAGQSIGYLQYAVVRMPSDQAGVLAQVQQLLNMTQPGMFNGLSPGDKASIKNFAVPQ